MDPRWGARRDGGGDGGSRTRYNKTCGSGCGCRVCGSRYAVFPRETSEIITWFDSPLNVASALFLYRLPTTLLPASSLSSFLICHFLLLHHSRRTPCLETSCLALEYQRRHQLLTVHLSGRHQHTHSHTLGAVGFTVTLNTQNLELDLFLLCPFVSDLSDRISGNHGEHDRLKVWNQIHQHILINISQTVGIRQWGLCVHRFPPPHKKHAFRLIGESKLSSSVTVSVLVVSLCVLAAADRPPVQVTPLASAPCDPETGSAVQQTEGSLDL